jgi:hypothetical protein
VGGQALEGEDDVPSPIEHDEHAAATKIQAVYRGHVVRRQTNRRGVRESVDQDDGDGDEGDNACAAVNEPVNEQTNKNANDDYASEEFDVDDDTADVTAGGSSESGELPTNTDGFQELETDTDAQTRERDEAAAIAIQAAYRGHAVRQAAKKDEAAAIAIQAAYRGHAVRRDSKAKRAQADDNNDELQQVTESEVRVCLLCVHLLASFPVACRCCPHTIHAPMNTTTSTTVPTTAIHASRSLMHSPTYQPPCAYSRPRLTLANALTLFPIPVFQLPGCACGR